MTRIHTDDNAHTTGTKALWAAAVASVAALAMMIVPALSYGQAVHFGAKLDPTVQPSNSLPAHPCNQLNPGSSCTMIENDAYGRAGVERAPKSGTIKKIRLIAGGPGSFKLQIAEVKQLDAAQHRPRPASSATARRSATRARTEVQLGLRSATGSSPSRSTSRSTGASTWRCGASTPRWCAAPPAATTR